MKTFLIVVVISLVTLFASTSFGHGGCRPSGPYGSYRGFYYGSRDGWGFEYRQGYSPRREYHYGPSSPYWYRPYEYPYYYNPYFYGCPGCR